jgi:hypothetical protein
MSRSSKQGRLKKAEYESDYTTILCMSVGKRSILSISYIEKGGQRFANLASAVVKICT